MWTWASFRGTPGNTGASTVPFLPGPAVSGSSVHIGGLVWGTAVARAAAEGGTLVYVGSTNRKFCCIHVKAATATARVRWTYRLAPGRADTLIDSAAALSPDGALVVVPGGDGRLHALSAETGALVWQFEAVGATQVEHGSGVIVNSFEGNVRFSSDGERVYAGCDDSAFYCVCSASGVELWRLRTGMMIWTVAGLLPDAGDHEGGGEAVVFGSLDGSLYAADGSTGRLIARHKTGGEVKASPLCAAADAVYCCNSNGAVSRLSLHAATSSFRTTWTVSVAGEVYASPALHSTLGVLVVADMEGAVTGLHVGDGRTLWRVDTHGHVAGSPTVTRADGVALVGTSRGALLALDVATGAVLGAAWLHGGQVHPRAIGPPRPDGGAAVAAPSACLNSSPVLLPSGVVAVGSYDGHVYFVPSTQMTWDGTDDHDDATTMFAPLDAQGRARTHVELVGGGDDAIVSFRLHVYDDGGRHVKRAAIDPSTLRVKGADDDDFDVRVSPDGRYVNLVPRGFPRDDDGPLEVTVTGTFREQTRSWLRDRVRGATTAGVTFECDPVVVARRRPPPPLSPSCYFETQPEAALCWDMSRMRCTQPKLLETYIPAAMAAQGFVVSVFGLRRGSRSFFLLCCPALPVDPVEEAGGFRVQREPAKVVVLRGEYEGDVFHARALGEFSFSAMGGTIGMSEYRMFGRVDPSTGDIAVEFYARASCLSIKGNGESYKFSPELLNQMCDPALDVHVVGGGHGHPSSSSRHPTPPRPAVAQDDHLVVWANVDDGAVAASVHRGPVAHVAPSCKALLFVDGRRYLGDGRGGGGLCNVPTRGVLSTDGYALTHVLAPLVDVLCDAGVSPNAITVSSMVTTLAMLWFHGEAAVAIVPLLMMYKWLADVLDGAVARRCDRQSKLGGVLDTAADALFTGVCVLLFWPWRNGMAVAMAVAVAPWVALVVANGPAALVSHGDFKNHQSWLNSVSWMASENTLVIVACLVVAYLVENWSPR